MRKREPAGDERGSVAARAAAAAAICRWCCRCCRGRCCRGRCCRPGLGRALTERRSSRRANSQENRHSPPPPRPARTDGQHTFVRKGDVWPPRRLSGAVVSKLPAAAAVGHRRGLVREQQRPGVAVAGAQHACQRLGQAGRLHNLQQEGSRTGKVGSKRNGGASRAPEGAGTRRPACRREGRVAWLLPLLLLRGLVQRGTGQQAEGSTRRRLLPFLASQGPLSRAPPAASPASPTPLSTPPSHPAGDQVLLFLESAMPLCPPSAAPWPSPPASPASPALLWLPWWAPPSSQPGSCRPATGP